MFKLKLMFDSNELNSNRNNPNMTLKSIDFNYFRFKSNQNEFLFNSNPFLSIWVLYMKSNI